MRTYTQEQVDYIREHYPDTEMVEMVSVLKKTPCSIYNKAYALGLKRSEKFMDLQREQMYEKLSESGKAFRFKKGHVSHNKGKKMPAAVYDKAKKTMFKPGHKPHNTRKDGDLSIRNKKGVAYKYIRVNEGNWQPLHRVVWEEHNGAIPKGFNVVFKDRNTMNCDISNLELISNKENMSRNTIVRYPEELIQAIRRVRKIEKLTAINK